MPCLSIHHCPVGEDPGHHPCLPSRQPLGADCLVPPVFRSALASECRVQHGLSLLPSSASETCLSLLVAAGAAFACKKISMTFLLLQCSYSLPLCGKTLAYPPFCIERRKLPGFIAFRVGNCHFIVFQLFYAQALSSVSLPSMWLSHCMLPGPALLFPPVCTCFPVTPWYETRKIDGFMPFHNNKFVFHMLSTPLHGFPQCLHLSPLPSMIEGGHT